jgi:hypothetical protein
MSHNYRDGGKGDKPRPMPNKEQFDKNWESVFGKKQETLKNYIEQKENQNGNNFESSK